MVPIRPVKPLGRRTEAHAWDRIDSEVLPRQQGRSRTIERNSVAIAKQNFGLVLFGQAREHYTPTLVLANALE